MIKIDKILIYDVKKDSIAEEIGLKKGDYILTINGEKVIDILDYKFITQDEYIELEIMHEDGEIEIFEIEKDEDEELGFEFEHELIDKPKNCHNKCIFCFMEQLPKNVRDTLIFKDDDYRLSFFTGNYITMTNMKKCDVERIIKYRLSPINISIHATDEKTRCMMLNNRFAGEVLEYLDMLYKADIKINTQIVLCKGINDGEILDKTINDLSKYVPALQSICIVPVGLSKNREGLYPLEKLTSKDCKETIDTIKKYQESFKKKYKKPIVYLADEFYLKANEKFPKYADYLDFGQLEDGIGMIPLFEHEFDKELIKLKRKIEKNNKENKIKNENKNKTLTLITGKITEDFIKEKANRLMNEFQNLKINVLAIENEYFGKEITVTGLVVGSDIINTIINLKNKNYNFGDYIVIPEVMLKEDEDIFLDDTSLIELQEKIGISIVVSDTNAKGFLQAILSNIPNEKIYKFNKIANRQSYENSINH